MLEERVGVDLAAIRAQVDAEGFARLRGFHTDDDLVALARGLGEIVADTPVRIVPGKRTYLASPNPIPMHTDHPMADLIAWRCAAQDAGDGTSLLVDGREAIAALSVADREQLARTLLPAMVRLGDEPTPTPILASTAEDAALFYAPWLEPIGKPPTSLEPLAALRRALEQARVRPIRLAAGEILVANNKRILHGRAAVAEGSARRLRRLWIRS